MFVTLEGPEGSGKTTLAGSLARRLQERGHRPLVTFEPGGTPLGQAVRDIVFHGVGNRPDESSDPIQPRAETLLFCSARAQLVDTVIVPHLASGGDVICDRYLDSTLAYQCFGRGLPIDPVRATLDFATGGLRPGLTVLLDLDVDEGLKRKRGAEGESRIDRFESEALSFHERVRQGYLSLAADEPDRWIVIDAALPPDEVARLVWDVLKRRLPVRSNSGPTRPASDD